ncbi:RrF2 family transcriptional regulator [Faecalimonas sp.]
MQFSSQTEYSIRILLYLACQQEKGKKSASISTISEALGINRNYLPKILRPLREHKLLQSEAGSQGGFSLAIDPQKISLLDIFEVTEGVIKINPCLDDSIPCNLNRDDVCPVRKIYLDFQQVFEEHFGSKTLADLVAEEFTMQKS